METRSESLDSDTKVSDNILADYLLDNCGLSETQKLMIRTSVGNRRSFLVISEALRRQHSKVHLCERRQEKTMEPKAFRSWHRPRQGQSSSFTRRPFQRRAFNAEMDTDEYDDRIGDQDEFVDEADGESFDSDRDTGVYRCLTCVGEGECDSVEDQLEQDVVTAYLAAGADLNDRDTAEECSDCFHNELFALMSREQAQTRGVDVQRRIHSFRGANFELVSGERP